VNWIADPPGVGEELRVQLRHRAADVVARIVSADEATMSLKFAEPQRAVTPGQSGVLYRGDELIGGGLIR
jgi:tRNA-specific 2-thiouridylase